MSKTPRLPTLINRLIEVNWIGDESSTYTLDPDPSIPKSFDQSKLIAPFKCFYNGSCVHDSFYSIPASSSCPLPSACNLLITDWTLSYSTHLTLNILKAEVLSELKQYREYPIINVESNPSVSNTIRRFKFYKIHKELREAETSSECSENSLMFLSGIEKLAAVQDGEKEEDVVEKVEEAKEEDEVEGVEEDGKRRQVVNSEDVLEMVKKEKGEKNSNIILSFDIEGEVFPKYALDYLQAKYFMKG